MARINIEDSLSNDERFLFVCDKVGRYSAMGQFVYIIKLAQKYWIEGSLIPESVYSLGEFSSEFFYSGLVEKREDGLYLKGSEEHFSWIISKVKNGRKGGRPRKNNNLEKAKITEKKPTENCENPLTLAPALTLTKNTNTILSAEPTVMVDFVEITEIWNNMAKQVSLPCIKKNTKLYERLEKISKKAIRDYPDVESWERIIEIVPNNKFRIGENERFWKASIEWLFQKSPTKKIENYVLLMQEWEIENGKGE